MPVNGNAKDCFELPPTNFSIFTLKNVTWRTYLISFPAQYCFPFRFVCIERVSRIWFLQIWVAIYVYGTMINWSTLIKKWMQSYIVIASGSILNTSTVHLNGIWHLIWRYLSKPVLGGHPVLSGHYSIPRGCPLNTGFTVSCSDWWNVFMLTDSRCCWQYRAHFNIILLQLGKRFFKTRISSKQYKFLSGTFRISLGFKKSKKYSCDLLQKEKRSTQNMELFLYSPVINYGNIYKATDL